MAGRVTETLLKQEDAVQFERHSSRNTLSYSRQSELIQQSLEHLLEMARRYHKEGSIRQATDMYWMLWDEHAGTSQALESRDCLMELAGTYESEGARHMARAIYERLSEV